MVKRQELLDFLHQSLMSGSTGCLEVHSDNLDGKLFLKFGHLIHAESPSFLGEEALWAILREEPDEFTFTQDATPEKETVTRPTELILMESAVAMDTPVRKQTTANPMPETNDFTMFQTTTSVQVTNEKDSNPRKMFLLSPGKTILGRSHRCDVVIGDKTVSRQHLEIHITGSDIIIKDLGGRNGTRVNSRQCNEATLQDNDILTVGTVTLRFFWSQNGEPVFVQEPLAVPDQSQTGLINLPPTS